jgi:hypothetical protein
MTEYRFTPDEMVALLEYVVHRATCHVIVHRVEDNPSCTCGLSKAMDPVRTGDLTANQQDRLATNRDVFGGRSRPFWLCELIPARHQPVSHRGRYQPSPMSDG